MQFPEKVLEDWLLGNPDAYSDCEHEFHWIGRQIHVASGIIDLLGVEVKPSARDDSYYSILHIVELKAEPAKSRHLTQVCRYAQDIEFGCDSLGLNVGIIKAVLATDIQNNCIQFEADALGVELREVSPAFSVSGPWGFKAEAREEHEKINIRECEKIACSILEIVAPNTQKQIEETSLDG